MRKLRGFLSVCFLVVSTFAWAINQDDLIKQIAEKNLDEVMEILQEKNPDLLLSKEQVESITAVLVSDVFNSIRRITRMENDKVIIPNFGRFYLRTVKAHSRKTKKGAVKNVEAYSYISFSERF